MSLISTTNATYFVDDDSVFDDQELNKAITIFSISIVSLCSLIVLVSLMRGTSHMPDEEVETGVRRREKKQQREEFILENLTVKEWHPGGDIPAIGCVTTAGSDEHSVVSTIVDNEDYPPSEAASVQGSPNESANESSRIVILLPSKSADDSSIDNPTSCPMGTDDTDECSFPKTMEDGPECAICLCGFEDHDEICESNNYTCDHVFHKNCMMGWLMEHEECPMCREIYLGGNSSTA
jgi:hypothetical protein